MPTNSSAFIPPKVQDFTVFPIQFPPQPSYPHAATHYLYLRPDSPKTADDRTEDTPRSIFVANIPIDATESSFRRLFKDLCGARVERVDFEGELQKPVLGIGGEAIVQGTQVSVPIEVKRGKKRKRGNSATAAEDEAVKKALAAMELPRTWDQDVWESGSSAVVVFVDQATRDLALKEARRMVKKGGMLEWPASGELGEKSTSKKLVISVFIHGYLLT
jgi:ribosomal RNA-processing protein 7